MRTATDLHLVRGGVSSYYRPSKKDRWGTIGERALAGDADVRIGLLAAYGDAGVERWVQFRGFRILESKTAHVKPLLARLAGRDSRHSALRVWAHADFTTRAIPPVQDKRDRLSLLPES